MKKLFTTAFCVFIFLITSACSQTTDTKNKEIEMHGETSGQKSENDSKAATDFSSANSVQTAYGDNENNDDNSRNGILVAYFSLAGEQYEVGIIEKGNTEIVAEKIAEKTGANLFKIEADKYIPIHMRNFWKFLNKKRIIRPLLQKR